MNTTQRNTPIQFAVKMLTSALLAIGVAGCTADRFASRPPAWGDTLHGAADSATVASPSQPPAPPAEIEEDEPKRPDADFYRPGSDKVVARVGVIADARRLPDGDVKLNFQNANLREVVKVILGDMLESNYSVDPQVQGSVSMQTTRALRREDLIPTLELLLRMNDAALVQHENTYRVVPLANALVEARAPQLGDSNLALPNGFGVRVVPLRYVAAEEMAQILGPFLYGSNQLVRVDSARNLLVIASSGNDMARLLETIDIFDVDQMAGMSVALFTPDFVDAATLVEDLEKLLADPEYGLMRGLVRFIVVERINGLMAVTSRAEHLARVSQWVKRLDRNTGDASPRLFIYRVQNGKAVDLADVLSGLFDVDSSSRREVPLAPGLEPATVGQAPEDAADDGESGNPAPPRSSASSLASAGNSANGLSINGDDPVKIIADEPNNALLILARGSQYRQILAALQQLDVSPMQVLIEVTIAEVTLTDNLSFGVEWFFENRQIIDSKTGVGQLDLGDSGLGAIVPGFSYAIRAAGGDPVHWVLNTLASESNLSIISSPSLLVLNNHEASIQIGDEVPITTQQQQTTSTDSNILNSIEYRDTGILLTVKPRINSGGLVILEVEQEASQVPSTATADPLTPRIQQRKISSTVAVNSGDTIILGGLIQDDRNTSESGIPGAHKIPLLGALFGTKADNQSRTELIVLITPRALTNGTEALKVTEEYRSRLKKLIPQRKPQPEDTDGASGNDAGPSGDRQTGAATESSPAATEAAPTQVPAATAEPAWSIRVGSFRDQARARTLIERLGDAGFATSDPVPVEINGIVWYRVVVRPTTASQQPATLLAQIEKATGIEGVLVGAAP